MTGEFDLEAAIVAFCATEYVDRDNTLNPRLAMNRQTDDMELVILVNEGIGGIKKRHASLAALAEAYVAEPEYPPDSIVVLVPAEDDVTDPDPFDDPLPELDSESESEPDVAVAGFSDIPGVSAALESRMHDAGILTYGDLEDAMNSGTIVQVPGLGDATAAKIRAHIWPKNDAE